MRRHSTSAWARGVFLLVQIIAKQVLAVFFLFLVVQGQQVILDLIGLVFDFRLDGIGESRAGTRG